MSDYDRIKEIMTTMISSKTSLNSEISELILNIAKKEELLKSIQEEVKYLNETLLEKKKKEESISSMIDETKNGFKQIQDATQNLVKIIESKYQ